MPPPLVENLTSNILASTYHRVRAFRDTYGFRCLLSLDCRLASLTGRDFHKLLNGPSLQRPAPPTSSTSYNKLFLQPLLKETIFIFRLSLSLYVKLSIFEPLRVVNYFFSTFENSTFEDLIFPIEGFDFSRRKSPQNAGFFYYTGLL